MMSIQHLECTRASEALRCGLVAVVSLVFVSGPARADCPYPPTGDVVEVVVSAEGFDSSVAMRECGDIVVSYAWDDEALYLGAIFARRYDHKGIALDPAPVRISHVNEQTGFWHLDPSTAISVLGKSPAFT